jgi:hypothetical protein
MRISVRQEGYPYLVNKSIQLLYQFSSSTFEFRNTLVYSCILHNDPGFGVQRCWTKGPPGEQWSPMSNASSLTKAKAWSKWPTFPHCCLLHATQCKGQPSCGPCEKPAKQAEKTPRTLNSLKLSSPKQHVLSLWFIQCFWRKWNSSVASKKDLWLKKNRLYLAEVACKVCSLIPGPIALYFAELILDPVNHCTFLLLGEELHSWNHSQENNSSLPDHPEL